MAANLVSGTPQPTRACKLGVTHEELQAQLGDRLPAFQTWLVGQTVAICEGRVWDYALGEWAADGCGPHGTVVYQHDLDRYLAGLPVID